MNGKLQALSDSASDLPEYTRKAIIILGMHRSGTSALTNLLISLGADGPATLMPPTQDNLKGYFESVPLYLLHDELLVSAGTSWDDYTPIPDNWVLSPKADDFRLKLEESLQSEYGRSGFFTVKDPRICRIVSLWRQTLAQMHVSPLFVHTHHNPIEVATSLHKRDGFDFEYGCLVWLRHILDAEIGSRGQVRSFTSYDRIIEDWPAEVAKIAADLKISWPRYSVFNASELNAIIEPDLKRNVAGLGHLRGNRIVSGWITQVHEIFTRWAISGEIVDDRQTLDVIRSAFDESVALFHGVVHRRGKGLIEERDEASRRAEEAATHVAEKQALINTLVAERDEAGERAAATNDELAERQALVDVLTAQRDKALEQCTTKDMQLSEQHTLINLLTAERDEAAHQGSKKEAQLAEQQLLINTLTTQRNEADERAAATNDELVKRQELVDVLMAQRNEAVEQCATKEMQLSEQQELIIQLTLERDEAGAQAQARGADLAKQQTLINTLVAERDEAKALAKTRGENLAEQQTLVEALTAERDAQIEQRHLDQSRLAQQKAELDDLWCDLDVSRKALAEAEKVRLDLAEQVARFSADLEQLRLEKSLYAQELVENRSIMEAHQEEIDVLRAQQNNDHRALADAKTQNAIDLQRITDLTAERDEGISRIEDLRVSSSIAAAQQTILLSQLQVRLAENEDRRRDMQIKIDIMNNCIQSSTGYRIKKLYRKIFR